MEEGELMKENMSNGTCITRKNLVVFTLIVIFLLFIPNKPVSAYEKTSQNHQFERANEHAEETFISYCRTLNEKEKENIDLKRIHLGDVNVVFDFKSGNEQLASFLYPVYEVNECVALFEVYDTVDGWCDSISVDNIEIFNKIRSYENEIILYKINDIEYIESKEAKYPTNSSEVIDESKMSKKEKTFFSKSFDEKNEYLNQKQISYYAMNNCAVDNKETTGYTPALSVNTGSKVTCAVTNYLASQGNKPICWAACVASTWNYYKGKKVTATQVCDKIKHGYSDANDNEIIKAFSAYGFRYKNVYAKKPNISNINACLRDHYLITAKLGTLDDNNIHVNSHAVLITGTEYVDGTSKVRVFNPQGSGSTKWVKFIGENTVLLKSWGWSSTFIPADHKPDNY